MNEPDLPPDDDDLATAEFADVLGLIDRVRRFERSSFSETPTSDKPPRSESIPLPEHVGRFQIRRAIGSGGFGLVFEADDPVLLRTVAIKLPRPEIAAAPRAAERFLQEGRAAAALNHPHIVPVFEVGEFSSIPYIATAYCAGPDLFEHLRANPDSIPPHAAAEIVSRLADAVEHAHRRGVLHRDLKPSNILLDRAPSDSGDDETCLADLVRISDFGLAKIEDADVSMRTSGSLGTPSYMPPEQADPTSTLGPTADVYSLGAILYELLCGEPPFRERTILATLDAVRSRPAVPPSRRTTGVPPDLEAIALKCMEKRPDDRYSSAAALRDDIDRFLRREPIHARKIGSAERAWRWCQRNPVVASLAMVVLVLAVSATVTAVGLAVSKRETTRALENVVRANRQSLRSEYDAQVALASSIRRAREPGQHDVSLAALGRAAELARRLDLGGQETLRLREAVIDALALPNLSVNREWPLTVVGETFLATGPDCESYVDIDDDRTRLRVRAMDDNRHLATLTLPPDCNRLIGVEYADDGTIVAARYQQQNTNPMSGSNERIRVWSLPDGTTVGDRPLGGFGHAAAFAPDGKSIAMIAVDGKTIDIRSLPSFERLDSLKRTNSPKTLDYSFDGKRLAVYGEAGIEIFDVDGGETVQRFPCPSFAYAIRFSPDSQRLAAACGDSRVRVYELEPDGNDDASAVRATPTLLDGHAAMVVRLAWHPSKPLLASVSMDGKSRLWDLRDGRPLIALGRKLTNFSRDGRYLGCEGGRLELSPSQTLRSYPQRDTKVVLPVDLGFYPRGDVTSEIDYWVALPDSRLVVGQNYFHAVFRDLASDAPLAELDLPGCWFRFSDDGRSLYASSQSLGFCRLPVERRRTGLEETIRIGPPEVIDPTPGGAFALADKLALRTPYLQPGRLLDVTSGEPLTRFDVHPFTFWCDLSPAAGLVATGAMKAGNVRVFDLSSGRQLRTLPSESAAPWFSPDGKRLVVAENARFTFFDTKTWEPAGRIESVAGGIWPGALAFSPDGRLLALESGSAIRLVDARDLTPVATFHVPPEELIESVAFSGDGRYLVSGGGDRHHTHVWDLTLLRKQLREFGLDWEPAAPPRDRSDDPLPIRLELELGPLADPDARPFGTRHSTR